jgi:predicted aldo/keto reductase-like oxidoreductase
MKYRSFGKLNWSASVLGFGAMRLPILGGDFGKIDEAKAIGMLRYAIDNGVNYIDTAYPYHMGNSETLVGKALRDNYREKVRLATKMPCWLINSQEDMDKYLSEQLAKLKVSKIDFYLLHGLTRERWEKLSKLDVLSWAERKIDEGTFEYLGFSFHDSFHVLKKILDSYDNWTLCQILYNYMDANYESGTRGLEYVASKKIAAIVMEPIAGGRLAMPSNAKIQAIWNKAKVMRTPAAWALLWVWNHPEVTLALSGMTTMTQVKENLETANIAEPGILSKEELRLYKKVASKYRQLGFVRCSACRYCQPCPNGVDVPTIISYYNEYFMKDRSEAVKEEYKRKVKPESRAKRCKKCGKCEELCPQHLPIRQIISASSFIFEQDS